MYAMKIMPAVKDYIWGGTNLKKYWNKKSDKDVIAESWELSCHKDGEGVIQNGSFKGEKLSVVLENNKAFCGSNCDKFKFFPILIKLIDAKQNLSIQVHPSDEYALANEDQFGKSEMWYVVDVEDGAGLYCGFNKEYTKEEVEEALNSGNIIKLLNHIKVKKGDCVYIPAGTVHAICGGLLICEIQQNSSLTYRLYDYDRVDKNGNKRELHIQKALDVIDTKKVCKVNGEVEQIDSNIKSLASCKYFKAYELKVEGSLTRKMDTTSFSSITCVAGDGKISFNGTTEIIKRGDTYFIPAVDGSFDLIGDLTIIEARV